MKAILVIDNMPNSCDECEVRCTGYTAKDYAQKGIKRPSWCPLKPMPLKRETMVHWKSIGGGDIPTHEISDYDKGWNDCVDFLEGELND